MKLFPIAAIATILAVTVSAAIPMEKRASCKTDDGIVYDNFIAQYYAMLTNVLLKTVPGIYVVT
jgi:hypothetical protein